MMQIQNINIIHKEQDEESGDIYYKIELDLLDPGAAFIKEQQKIDSKLRNMLHKINNKLH